MKKIRRRSRLNVKKHGSRSARRASAPISYNVLPTEGGWRIESGDMTMAATGIVLKGDATRATVSVSRAGALAHRDRVTLTSAKSRAAFVRDVVRKSIALNERALLAIDEAIRNCNESGRGDNCDGRDDSAGGSRPANPKTVLLETIESAELFHSPDGDTALATVSINEHHETWSIRGRTFKSWLVRQFYERTHSAPTTQALTEALGVIEARARYDGSARPVFLRVAEHDGAVFLDLCNEHWEAVEIRPDGWRVAQDVPVKFRRTRGMLPLPHPIHGGSLADLRPFINVVGDTDDQWQLLVAAIINAFRPQGPYFVLVLHGTHGSAKSTTSRIIRELIDPNVAALRAEPRDLRDFAISASNAWVIPLDNLSRLDQWLSDAICRLSTGGGFATRELYSDDDEIIFDVQRPVILNGIEEIVTRPDLLDRALILHLPEIDAEHRRREQEFWCAFDVARPRILGALLDAVCAALRGQGDGELSSLPRMADAAAWISAAEPVLGWPRGSFLHAYTANRGVANVLALEASPLTEPLQLVVGGAGWSGTLSQLLERINHRVSDETRRLPTWPKTPKALGNALRRLGPNLRGLHIEVEFLPRQSGARPIRLHYCGPDPISANSVTTVTTVTDSAAPGPSVDGHDGHDGIAGDSSSRAGHGP
jgi:hypothetical protein